MLIRSEKLGGLRQSVREELKAYYTPEELVAIERVLFSFITGLSPSKLVLEKETALTESQLFGLQRAVRRLKDQEPLQYITQQAHFRGLEFFVDDRVLIPRPETEELVEWVLESGIREGAKVMDIGTGSGCIAISIKAECRGSEVYAVDISSGALEVAQKNAEKLAAEVHFIEMDILDQDQQKELPTIDVIISNPPYVTPADKLLMKGNVVRYEPHLALFVGDDDPLVFYREIIHFSISTLNEGGRIFFECNERSVGQVAGMLSTTGFGKVEIKKDMRGKNRFVKGTV